MYIDWPALRNLGKTDPDLFVKIAALDLKSEKGEKMRNDFPQCFSPTPRPFDPNDLDA